ncbi:MAG: L,D-transpeptidase [Oricola sp.]
MRFPTFLSLALVSILLAAQSAGSARAADLIVAIDISDQEMTVTYLGREIHYWPVSTARPGYRTPTGTFQPYRIERMWYSTIYDNAPMPYSIFFLRGYAIHGTTDIRNLGKPASHGCVRLNPDNAKALYELVRSVGKESTEIVIRP